MVLMILLCFLHNVFTTPPCDGLSSFMWLRGAWKMEQTNGRVRLESWQEVNGNSMTGTGLKVNGVDTTVLETLQLLCSGDRIEYVATVPNQNNALPVTFNLVSIKEHRYIFENSQHDFPQRIIYDWRNKISSEPNNSSPGDSLFVRVETLSGEGIEFIFIKQ